MWWVPAPLLRSQVPRSVNVFQDRLVAVAAFGSFAELQWQFQVQVQVQDRLVVGVVVALVTWKVGDALLCLQVQHVHDHDSIRPQVQLDSKSPIRRKGASASIEEVQ